MAFLKNLDVFTSDVKNAYFQAPVTEKILTTYGPEFGEDGGNQAIIV